MQLYKWKVNKQTSKKWSCWKLKYWWIFTTFCYFLEDLQTVVHCSTLVCHCTTRPWLPSPPCTWSTNATRVKNNLIKVKSNLKCVVKCAYIKSNVIKATFFANSVNLGLVSGRKLIFKHSQHLNINNSHGK